MPPDPAPAAEPVVLYRDPHLLAINKPPGLLVHRGWGQDAETALTLARAIAGCWVYPIHRLDRGTSGVLLFGLSAEIVAPTQALFESGWVRKRYLALVRGIAPAAATVDHALAKEKGKPKLPARTHVARLSPSDPSKDSTGELARYSLVEAWPETGRTHQVRRHLKHLGHPIIGDVRYGKAEHNRRFRALGFARMALHAERLLLPHPRTGALLSLTAPLEADFRSILQRLDRLPEGDRPPDAALPEHLPPART